MKHFGTDRARYATPYTGTKPETAETAKGGAKSEGGSATTRAETRVNAEQASKHQTREPTLRKKGEGRRLAGKRANGTTGWFPPG